MGCKGRRIPESAQRIGNHDRFKRGGGQKQNTTNGRREQRRQRRQATANTANEQKAAAAETAATSVPVGHGFSMRSIAHGNRILLRGRKSASPINAFHSYSTDLRPKSQKTIFSDTEPATSRSSVKHAGSLRSCADLRDLVEPVETERGDGGDEGHRP